MSEYGDGYVTADRQPENRLECQVDAEGYVTSARLLSAAEDSDFIAVMRAARQPIDPAEIEMHGVPIDAEGRGLSVLEMKQTLTTTEDKAA